MRQILIISSGGRWPPGTFDGEIWGLGTLWKRVKLDRTFELHDRETVENLPAASKPHELAALGIPVYMQERHPEVPLSIAYPLAEVSRRFRRYFTGTVAYLLGLAAYEHVTGQPIARVLLRSVHCGHAATEYAGQKACFDYWCGVLEGLGIEIIMPSDCWLARPYPWQPEPYGYGEWDVAADQVLTAAVRQIMGVKHAA